MKKIRKRSASWLAKSARRGFRGYPIATVALYGPTADLATKIAVSIIPDERNSPDQLERWFSEGIDIRCDPVVGEQILVSNEVVDWLSCLWSSSLIVLTQERSHGRRRQV